MFRYRMGVIVHNDSLRPSYDLFDTRKRFLFEKSVGLSDGYTRVIGVGHAA